MNKQHKQKMDRGKVAYHVPSDSPWLTCLIHFGCEINEDRCKHPTSISPNESTARMQTIQIGLILASVFKFNGKLDER